MAAAPGFLAATGLVAGTLTIIDPVLVDGTWVKVNLTAGAEHWYSFTVTNGTPYYIWWDDESHGSGNGNTVDIVVGIRYAGESTWIIGGATGNSDANGWTTVQTIVADRTGTVEIRVKGYNATSNGNYAIVYSTTNVRPTY